MSQEAVERLLGRLLTDDEFRKKAGNSLGKACRGAGYDLNEDEIKAIRPDDIMRLEMISLRLDRGIKRFSEL
jgi:hypothetical protein